MRAFFSLKKWHPDKFVKNPSVAGEAKLRFQQIQEAYSGSFVLLSFIHVSVHRLREINEFSVGDL